MDRPQTPMLDKMGSVKDDSQKLGAFLEWLQGRNVWLCMQNLDPWGEADYCPIAQGIEEVLAEYFEIDLRAVEYERRALLEWHRRETNPDGRNQDS